MKAIAASFNAIAMVALAFTVTDGSFASSVANAQIWGSAAAAVTAALVVLTSGPAALGWIAVGYVLSAAFWRASPVLVLVLLAVAFMPILPRPRSSLGTGLLLAVVSAVAFRVVAALLV